MLYSRFSDTQPRQVAWHTLAWLYGSPGSLVSQYMARSELPTNQTTSFVLIDRKGVAELVYMLAAYTGPLCSATRSQATFARRKAHSLVEASEVTR